MSESGGILRRNVLFVHQAAEMYGSDKVLLYLVKGLLSRGRFWPIVVLPEHGPLFAALREAGVEVHVAAIAKVKRAVFTPLGLLGLLGQMLAAVRDYDRVVAGREVAVVHSNTLAVLGGAAWAWRRRVKHLWHVHEIILSPRLVSRAFPWLVRVGSDKVVSNSTLTERWLLSHQPRLKDRSVVIFNGLPSEQDATAEAAQQFRGRTGAKAGQLLVVLAGRLNHWKGQGLLIEAALRLKARGQLSALHIAIVGDTAPGQEALRTVLLDQVATAGLADAVTFVPFVDDIRPVWGAADIAVVPSIEPEPFGMVAIEAMAGKAPVIAAAHGGLLDIVEHEVNGLLVTPRDADALADALHRLAHDAALRERLAAEGKRSQLQRFSAESQVDSFERVYDDLRKAGRSKYSDGK
ncbi:glycosyltransferase family 4 protein [Roseateles cellulosilyticus]|uniref:Glycosyltransferase family 4 protein n=1 Tax=Pelomonas cellulosilytica TaxID=2906762 RepID=A0ABS8Y402_9BURK|nr:glycosyltransferase family 4 protein [Pelomonas sp. P8]MCE4557826.1 glycosyltransferase family 4 protein [Pelomonas sp. P8]